MPRSHRRRPDDALPLDVSRALGGHRRERDTGSGEEWNVRTVPASAAVKEYRCPGCDQLVKVGVVHLVVWPTDHLFGVDGAAADRRHWHRGCWTARDRRRPR